MSNNLLISNSFKLDLWNTFIRLFQFVKSSPIEIDYSSFGSL